MRPSPGRASGPCPARSRPASCGDRERRPSARPLCADTPRRRSARRAGPAARREPAGSTAPSRCSAAPRRRSHGAGGGAGARRGPGGGAGGGGTCDARAAGAARARLLDQPVDAAALGQQVDPAEAVLAEGDGCATVGRRRGRRSLPGGRHEAAHPARAVVGVDVAAGELGHARVAHDVAARDRAGAAPLCAYSWIGGVAFRRAECPLLRCIPS